MKNIIIILMVLISSICFSQINTNEDDIDTTGNYSDTLLSAEPIDIDIDNIDEVKYCEDALAGIHDPKYANLSDSVKFLLIARYISHYEYDDVKAEFNKYFNRTYSNTKYDLFKTIPTSEFIKSKKGVCADFAALIRLLGRQLKLLTDWHDPTPDHRYNHVVYNNVEYVMDGTHFAQNKYDRHPKKYYYMHEILRPAPCTFIVENPGVRKIPVNFGTEKDKKTYQNYWHGDPNESVMDRRLFTAIKTSNERTSSKKKKGS